MAVFEEEPIEIGEIPEARRKSDFEDAVGGGQEELFCLGDAGLDDIFRKAGVDGAPEESTEGFDGHLCLCGGFLDAEF